MFDVKTKFQERIPRSLAKVITWRVLVTITNFIGGWLASGNPWVGLGVVGFALVVNSTLYFFHERAWNRADWGKKVEEENSTESEYGPLVQTK
jgi:uncharacterized membrane protein